MSVAVKLRRTGNWAFFFPVIFPLVFLSAYLFFSRWPERWFTGVSDWGALIFSVLLGVACVAILPLRILLRMLIGLIYLPIGFVFLFYYTFLFLGMVFGDAL
jgi:hypothetical protein